MYNDSVMNVLLHISRKLNANLGDNGSVALEMFADGSGCVSHVVAGNDGIESVTQLLSWNNEAEFNVSMSKYVSRLSSGIVSC